MKSLKSDELRLMDRYWRAARLMNAPGIIAAIVMSAAALATFIVWTSSWLKY